MLILSKHAGDYQRLIDAARLPQLHITAITRTDEVPPKNGFEIVLGEPSLIRVALPRLVNVRWVQSTWAGVEPLLDPALRRDYVLTNARGVFGALMSEYVFGYMLAHERLMFEKLAAQRAGRWDPTPPGTLRGKQIGLLGVGSIGAALAATAKHFGMRVKGYTRASEGCADVDEYFHSHDRVAFAANLVDPARKRVGKSRPVSRVLSRAIIPLGSPSPWTSSGLPGSARGSALRPPGEGRRRLPYLALLQVGFTVPSRVATDAVRSYRTVSPLPVP